MKKILRKFLVKVIPLGQLCTTRKIVTENSTSKIKTPDKLSKFLLCFLLLNESFKAGVVTSGNILESFKNSSIVSIGSMAAIGVVLGDDFVPKV